MPARAIIEPTERSMPPEMIMAVMPTAMMAFTLERRKMFRKLSAVRNLSGTSTDRAMRINSRLAKGSSWRRSLITIAGSFL
jgi:hypothetical protein